LARGPETALAEADDTLRRQQRETERVGPMLAALIHALNGSEAGGRLDAARALGAIGGGARLAVVDLGQRLLEDPNPEVRSASAWAIGQTGSLEGTRYLGAAALRDTSVQVRFEAVSSLGRTADPTSVSVLAAALGDASDQVRAAAAWGLGTVRPSSAPPALIAALSDSVHSVQEHAAWALGRIRDSAAVPGLAVLARDVDHYSKVGFEALWALAQIGGDAARPALAEALRTQQMDPHLRDAVEAALAGRRVEGLPRPTPRGHM
jgi:HEAT repeat protein